jgi:hypothetical protein
MGKKRQANDGPADGKKHKKQRKEESSNAVVSAKEDSVSIFDHDLQWVTANKQAADI